MLDTLIRIGRHLSEGRGEWDDIIDIPDTVEEQAKGITPLTAQILFDLDTNQVVLDKAQLKVFETADAYSKWNVRSQGRKNKKIYISIDPRRSFDQFRKTFFGASPNEMNPSLGDFAQAISNKFPELQYSAFYKSLQAVASLSDKFDALFMNTKVGKADYALLSSAFGLAKNERIVLLYAAIINQGLGIFDPTPFYSLSGYKKYLQSKFQIGVEDKKEQEQKVKQCYASGGNMNDVESINILSNDGITNMFVTTTVNFASNFSKSHFYENYQISKEIQLYLERGSEFLLSNYSIRIAGVPHVIIPSFFSQHKVDLGDVVGKVFKKTDLLFSFKKAGELTEDLDLSDNELYWLTFLGYDRSAGKFFKTINTIHDVSKLHFNKLIETFIEADRAFSSISGIEWEKIKMAGKDNPISFNFYTLYTLIPVRKDKEKKNAALAFFKAILEQRKTDPQLLYHFFTELILCHWYGRYKAYGNIYPNEAFDFAARNAVYQYHALFYILRQLNLLKGMEKSIVEESQKEELKPVEAFFQKMNYNDSQKAMFYLGRVLNSVAYAQQKKSHDTKPILNKVNYNGMDKKTIIRLHKDLFEKCRQYSILSYNELHFSHFTQLFNESSWSLKPAEALFYLLAGYSFRDNA